MNQSSYDEETKRKTAEEAVKYCRESGNSLHSWAKANGRDAKVIRTWVGKYFPDDLMRYYTPKAAVASSPAEKQSGFVPLARDPQVKARDIMFKINYHGAEIETDEDGLGTVLRAVQALSRSAL